MVGFGAIGAHLGQGCGLGFREWVEFIGLGFRVLGVMGTSILVKKFFCYRRRFSGFGIGAEEYKLRGEMYSAP